MSEDSNNLPAVIDAKVGNRNLAEMRSGGRPMPIVAQSFEDAYRLATAVMRAGLAPESLKSAEACCVAILMGAEVGLTPMMAIQKIAVINGRATIWGDAALALVRASGLLEDFDEEYDEATKTARCTVKRKGDKRPLVRTFSEADAIAANLSGKAIWKQYRRRMLQMRARAFALRDGFADVLGGLYLAEEIQEEERAPRAAPVDDTPPDPNAVASPTSDEAPNPEGGSDEEKKAAPAHGDDAGTEDDDPPDPDGGTEDRREDAPAPEDADAGGVDADMGELPPLDDVAAQVEEWVATFEAAPTAEDLRQYFEDERIGEHIDSGVIEPPEVTKIEDAYNTAMARL